MRWFFFAVAVTGTFFKKKDCKNKPISLCYQSCQCVMASRLNLDWCGPTDTTGTAARLAQPKIADHALQQRILLWNNHEALTSQCLSPTSFTVIGGTSANLLHFTDIFPRSCSPPASAHHDRQELPARRAAATAGREELSKRGRAGQLLLTSLKMILATLFLLSSSPTLVSTAKKKNPTNPPKKWRQERMGSIIYKSQVDIRPST